MRFFDAPVLDEQREPLLPHKIVSGQLPGATEIRIGGTTGIKLSGLDQRMTITASDGSSVGLGTIPGDVSNFGFFATNASGTLIQKIVLGTTYVYDPDTGLNTVQFGILPDGTGGMAGANEGYEVEDGFA